jgi:hypothetical protein
MPDDKNNSEKFLLRPVVHHFLIVPYLGGDSRNSSSSKWNYLVRSPKVTLKSFRRTA